MVPGDERQKREVIWLFVGCAFISFGFFLAIFEWHPSLYFRVSIWALNVIGAVAFAAWFLRAAVIPRENEPLDWTAQTANRKKRALTLYVTMTVCGISLLIDFLANVWCLTLLSKPFQPNS